MKCGPIFFDLSKILEYGLSVAGAVRSIMGLQIRAVGCPVFGNCRAMAFTTSLRYETRPKPPTKKHEEPLINGQLSDICGFQPLLMATTTQHAGWALSATIAPRVSRFARTLVTSVGMFQDYLNQSHATKRFC